MKTIKLAVILTVLFLLTSCVSAENLDSVKASNNTLSTANVNLNVTGETMPFTFSLKPGENQTQTITIENSGTIEANLSTGIFEIKGLENATNVQVEFEFDSMVVSGLKTGQLFSWLLWPKDIIQLKTTVSAPACANNTTNQTESRGVSFGLGLELVNDFRDSKTIGNNTIAATICEEEK